MECWIHLSGRWSGVKILSSPYTGQTSQGHSNLFFGILIVLELTSVVIQVTLYVEMYAICGKEGTAEEVLAEVGRREIAEPNADHLRYRGD